MSNPLGTTKVMVPLGHAKLAASALLLTAGVSLAAPSGDAGAPAAPILAATSEAAKAVALPTRPEPAAGYAKIDESKASESKAVEGRDDGAMPLRASAYASADPETPIAFPAPGLSATPPAPIPEVPDPARAARSGDTDVTLLRSRRNPSCCVARCRR